MIFNIDNLKAKASGKKNKFISVVEKVSKMKGKNVDSLFHDLHYKEFQKIDCLDCANCCKSLGPRLTNKDIERLSTYLRIKNSDFSDKYILVDEDKDYVFKSIPCPFLLEDNSCSVYPARPKACRAYPHTDQNNINAIITICLRNTETCPVVYNIFNILDEGNGLLP